MLYDMSPSLYGIIKSKSVLIPIHPQHHPRFLELPGVFGKEERDYKFLADVHLAVIPDAKTSARKVQSQSLGDVTLTVRHLDVEPTSEPRGTSSILHV